MALQSTIVAQLVHISGPLKGKIQEFSEPEIAIGRHPSCAVRFPADLVLISRNHAKVIREGNTFKLIDSSTNGTFVNGKRVKEVSLKSGDVITLAEAGPKFSFLTQMKEIESAPEAPPPPIVETPTEPPPPESTPVQKKEEIKPPGSGIEQREAPLVIQYGPTLRSFKMVPVVIGRNPSCDVVLDHASLLDRHAEFFFSGEQYWVRDLTGAGTVQVNRRPAGPSGLPVNMNDELLLAPGGPAFRFLGQGRFVELDVQAEEAPPEKTEDDDSQTGDGVTPPRDRKSLFKKYFRH
jgi:pSer/pThr/pTyr-binding forkhead associated (FHA) protein